MVGRFDHRFLCALKRCKARGIGTLHAGLGLNKCTQVKPRVTIIVWEPLFDYIRKSEHIKFLMQEVGSTPAGVHIFSRSRRVCTSWEIQLENPLF